MSRDDFVDQDGRIIPAPGLDTDLGQLEQFLQWCRRAGFRPGPVLKFGAITVQVRDRRDLASEDAPPAPGIWEQHGYGPDKEG